MPAADRIHHHAPGHAAKVCTSAPLTIPQRRVASNPYRPILEPSTKGFIREADPMGETKPREIIDGKRSDVPEQDKHHAIEGAGDENGDSSRPKPGRRGFKPKSQRNNKFDG